MSDEVYDIAIIGGGPAGLTSAIYAARARMKTVLIESMSVMGQLTMTEKIENYPGLDPIGGFDLVDKMKAQAVAFGVETVYGTVQDILKNEENDLWTVRHDGASVTATTVIIASGARPRKLGVPGEDEFSGKGVSYCATCDAAFFKDKSITVVGGGNTAVEEALYLTKFGKAVHVVHRRDRFRADKIVQERADANEKLIPVWKHVLEKIEGSDKVEKLILKNVDTGEISELVCDGLFIFAGWTPNTDFTAELVEKDDGGNIIVDERMKTSTKGVYACGDCCYRPLKQVITACGDGAIAAVSAQKYVEKLRGTEYV